MAQRVFDIVIALYVVFTALMALAVVMFDVYAVYTGSQSVTVYVRDLARREPMLVFLFGGAIGALAGHLFWVRP